MIQRRIFAPIAVLTALIALAFGSVTASAQEGLGAGAGAGAAAPQVEKFGNWAGRCQQMGLNDGSTRKVCNVYVDIRAEEDPETRIISVAIGPNIKDGGFGAIALTPLGTLLPQGVGFKIDENKEFGAPFVICHGGGCEAHMALSTDNIQQMRAGNTMQVAFVHAQRGPVKVPVSLSGISAAFDWLSKQ
ncbi:invasion associated locus B family protein [Tepidicaulis sp.]|jgi:invasion protein IalB|uniref:invasion associated locus B family protein n=1 Tax=Tepidicaulis sp. TaxID=1920809 RepID=UPI003B5C7BA1